MERRVRNWVYDRVLSGDIIVEQNIHVIDVCNWMLQGHPVKAQAAGGREIRPDSAGDAYDHYNMVFSYPDDVHVTLSSTQFDKGWWDVNERFFGSKGVSESHYSGPCAIYGDETWAWDAGNPRAKIQRPTPRSSPPPECFTTTSRTPTRKRRRRSSTASPAAISITRRRLGVESALSAMLGRTAAYQGHEVTWDELLAPRRSGTPGSILTHLG